MEDEKILNLYQERREEAVSATAAKYGGYCYSIANSILHSQEDAEECVNDTWLRAWNSIPPQRPRKLSLFLGKIVRNLSFDKYTADRTQKRGGGEIAQVLEELEDCVPCPGAADQPALDEELSRSINEFLRTLPRQACTVFLYRYWYNRPVKELAAQLSMRENNVKASLFRSRAKLKKHLEKEGILI